MLGCIKTISSITKLYFVLSIQRLSSSFLNKVANKRVLICGDGDFSFSYSLSKLDVCRSIVSTTLDTLTNLKVHYPHSTTYIQSILSFSPNNQVHYEVDATKLNYDPIFDVVIWNFPHINGKANIRYNRELLKNFLNSSKSCLASNGAVLCSLCNGQSGVDFRTIDEWNFSWQLPVQASEAGFMIVEYQAFEKELFQYYTPKGHRGYGGGFDLTNAKTFTLQQNVADHAKQGLPLSQNPLVYVHEIHVYKEIENTNLDDLELHISTLTQQLCLKSNFPESFCSCSLVDIYRCPRTQLTTMAFQIGYCCQNTPFSRQDADQLRQMTELRLPAAAGLKPRVEKHRSLISKGYPWIIANHMKKLKNSKPSDYYREGSTVLELWHRRAGNIALLFR